MSPVPPPVDLPAGRELHLPGRGRTFVREAPGPDGAPTLLLLHGWTVTADLNWFACFGPLARRFRVVALDHRGHGRGIRSKRPFRLEDCADDAAALAGALDIDRLIPVGYSMGGPVAQLMWRRHPRLVAGLVLCATAADFSSPDARSRLYFSGLLGLSVAARLTPEPVRRQVADNLIRRRLNGATLADWGQSQMGRSDPASVLEAGWAIGRFRSSGWVGGIDVPTAVVVTARDEVVSPRRQQALAAAIPGARRLDVDGGHGACVVDPARFVPTLLEACTDVASRADPPPPSR